MANYPLPQEVTDAELLTFTKAAIEKILATGTAYSMDGRSMTRADLSDLEAQRDRLEARINTASRRNKTNLANMRK